MTRWKPDKVIKNKIDRSESQRANHFTVLPPDESKVLRIKKKLKFILDSSRKPSAITKSSHYPSKDRSITHRSQQKFVVSLPHELLVKNQSLNDVRKTFNIELPTEAQSSWKSGLVELFEGRQLGRS